MKVKSSYDRIQTLMASEGLTKKQLAAIAGVGPSAVTKWASGGAIRMQQLQRIADHFNVSVTQLFPIAETNSPEVNVSEIDWKQRALVSERKLAAVQEALALILKGTQKLQQAMQ